MVKDILRVINIYSSFRPPKLTTVPLAFSLIACLPPKKNGMCGSATVLDCNSFTIRAFLGVKDIYHGGSHEPLDWMWVPVYWRIIFGMSLWSDILMLQLDAKSIYYTISVVFTV